MLIYLLYDRTLETLLSFILLKPFIIKIKANTQFHFTFIIVLCFVALMMCRSLLTLRIKFAQVTNTGSLIILHTPILNCISIEMGSNV